MIITRSPLRISLGGGGTDLPSYYGDHGGFVIAAAIDKYVWVTVLRPFVRGILLKYSKIEQVDQIAKIEHPIIREAFRMMSISDLQHEITTVADIPAGTGLGSSGSFTTALLKALHTYKRGYIHPSELAAQAGVSRQAVTKTLDELERVGLVEREPHPADGRGVLVRYTPRGLAALQVARTCGNEVERRFASQIGARQWRTVRNVLEALFDGEGTSQPHR